MKLYLHYMFFLSCLKVIQLRCFETLQCTPVCLIVCAQKCVCNSGLVQSVQISKLVRRGRQYSCLVCADKSASLCRARRIVCRAVWLSGVADSLPAFSATHHFFTHSRPATHLVLDYFAQKILVQEYLCLLSDCMSMCGDVWFEFNRSQHGLWEKTYLVSSGLDTVWASTF